MSVKRLPDETQAQYKARQKADTRQQKQAVKSGRLLIDSTKALGITQKGIDATKQRKMRYDMQAAVNANLSNSKRRQKGLGPKK